MRLFTHHTYPSTCMYPVQGRPNTSNSSHCFFELQGRGVSAPLGAPARTPEEGPQATPQCRHGDHSQDVALEALEMPRIEASLRSFGHLCLEPPFPAEVQLFTQKELYHLALLELGWGELTHSVVEICSNRKALIFVKVKRKPRFRSYMHISKTVDHAKLKLLNSEQPCRSHPIFFFQHRIASPWTTLYGTKEEGSGFEQQESWITTPNKNLYGCVPLFKIFHAYVILVLPRSSPWTLVRKDQQRPSSCILSPPQSSTKSPVSCLFWASCHHHFFAKAITHNGVKLSA